jgi:hypothetical protein
MTKRITITALALIACASSSLAAIGETPQQFEPGKPNRFVNLSNGTGFTATWEGRRVIHMGTFTGPEQICTFETFWFRDGHQMSRAEVNKFLEPYYRMGLRLTGTRGAGRDFYLVGRQGTDVAVVKYDQQYEMLSVFSTLSTYQALVPPRASRAAPAPAPRQAPQPQLAPEPDTSQPKDCLIVATETMGRLKGKAQWVRILGIALDRNGMKQMGHAVVLYQPAPDANVYMYDNSGSRDLGTVSHDLTDLRLSLDHWLNVDGYNITSIYWVGAE